MALFALGVGLANFASGRDLSPGAVVAAIADEVAVVASYGSTGNVAFEDPVAPSPLAAGADRLTSSSRGGPRAAAREALRWRIARRDAPPCFALLHPVPV
jgi:hypothetical protein